MKRLTMILVCCALLVGCVEESDVRSVTEVEPPPPQSTLELTYISGHLGAYWDCPEQAYQPEDPTAEPADGLISGDADWAACPPDVECPAMEMNCLPAQVTVRIANVGDAPVSGVNVSEVILLDAEGAEHTALPILVLTALEPGSLESVLAPGAFVDVRVDYRAPLDPAGYLQSNAGNRLSDAGMGQGVKLRVRAEAEQQEPAHVDTPELYSQPMIDT